MIVTLHPAWHPIAAHFDVGMTMAVSLLIMVGLVSRLVGVGKLARSLTFTIRILSLLSLISITMALAGALMDFPVASLAASPWFTFKITMTMTIIVFFIYAGIYYMIEGKKELVWSDNVALTYITALAIAGSLSISLLGAAGGHLGYGHSVLEPLLKIAGLPLPEA